MQEYLSPALIYALVVVLFILLYLWSTYNSFVKKRNQVKTDLSDINVQIKKKADLVQNLIDLTKDYATHEKDTFKGVAEMRSSVNVPGTAAEAAKTENMLTNTLRSLMMVVESNPELKANQNFLALTQDLKNIENLIAEYREEYNKTVLNYNNSVQTFPGLVAAKVFGFESEDLFDPAI